MRNAEATSKSIKGEKRELFFCMKIDDDGHSRVKVNKKEKNVSYS
jgi:hypothetical protein